MILGHHGSYGGDDTEIVDYLELAYPARMRASDVVLGLIDRYYDWVQGEEIDRWILDWDGDRDGDDRAMPFPEILEDKMTLGLVAYAKKEVPLIFTANALDLIGLDGSRQRLGKRTLGEIVNAKPHRKVPLALAYVGTDGEYSVNPVDALDESKMNDLVYNTEWRKCAYELGKAAGYYNLAGLPHEEFGERLRENLGLHMAEMYVLCKSFGGRYDPPNQEEIMEDICLMDLSESQENEIIKKIMGITEEQINAAALKPVDSPVVR